MRSNRRINRKGRHIKMNAETHNMKAIRAYKFRIYPDARFKHAMTG